MLSRAVGGDHMATGEAGKALKKLRKKTEKLRNTLPFIAAGGDHMATGEARKTFKAGNPFKKCYCRKLFKELYYRKKFKESYSRNAIQGSGRLRP